MMRSRVRGMSWMRTPSAWATALPIAAAVGPHRAFADAERGIAGAVDQFGLHLRHLAEAQDRIAVPVARGDAVLVEPHLLLQGPAHGLDDAALELVARAVGIDHQAGIGDAPHAIDLHGLLHRDGGRHGGIGGAVLVAGEAETEALAGAGRPARGPVGALGHQLDQPPRTRLGQDRQAIGDGILADARRQLVHQRSRWRRRWAARPARAAPRCAPAGAARDGAGCDAPARRRAARRCACRRRRAPPADRSAPPRAADWPAPRRPADSRCRCPAAGRGSGSRSPSSSRPAGRARRDRHAGSPAWPGRPARSRTPPRGAIAGGCSGRECAWRPARRRAPHRRRRCGRSSRRRAGAAR